MQLNVYSIPPFIAAMLTLALGLFIYTRNRRSSQNIAYSLECLCVFLWFLAYSVMFSSKSESIGTLWGKIGYVGVTFIPITFYHFAVSILKIEHHQKIIKAIYAIGTIFALSLFTDYYISGVISHFWGYYTRANFLHPVFLLFFMTLYNGSLFLLFKYMRQEHKDILQRNKIKYVFLAFLIPAFASVDFAPSYGFGIYPFGYIFIFAWLSVTAYAIVKHQLMEIEVIIRRAVVFAGLFAALYGIIAFFTFLTQDVFLTITGGNRWFTLVPSIFIIILALRPLDNLLVGATDKFLFQKKYDYKELFKTFSDDVLSVMDLNKILNETINIMTEILRAENCGILVLNKNKKIYELTASKGIRAKNLVFDADTSPLIAFLRRAQIHIVSDKNIQQLGDKDTVKEDMKKLESNLVLPLILHEELIGAISLGSKKSGEPYIQDDLDILIPLSKSEAVAISNAQAMDDLTKTQAEAAQREKMAVIGTLAAGINHEICNPLGIARGQCEVFLLNARDGLYNKRPKEEQVYEAMKIMEKVMKETDRATAITKKLSSFAKPGSGDLNEDVDIAEEVDEVLTLVGHELELEKIGLVKDIPKNLPHIKADRKQIQEIFFNLIRNAGQAIHEKGEVAISAREVDSKIAIDIADTGHGIPEDKLDDIFNPFYTTKVPGKGTGLGLFIVRQVVNRNRGTISVKSEVGKGTTFTLEFPIPQESEAIQ